MGDMDIVEEEEEKESPLTATNQEMDIEMAENEDYFVDKNGLFTFESLMAVDTDTHITCMDAGVMGRTTVDYKWKKPKDVIAINVDKRVDKMAKKQTLSNDTDKKSKGNVAKRLAIQRRRQKRSKAKNMDISRFD